MSFGFGISDFLRLLEVAKVVYDATKSGPREYRELSREIKSLQVTLTGLSGDAQDPDSLLNQRGTRRRREILAILNNCEEALRGVQNLIDKHSRILDVGAGKLRRIWDSYKVGSTDLDDVRGKMTFHISTISLFLQTLEGSAVSRIEVTVNRIYARLLRNDATQASYSSISVASTESILSLVLTNENEAWELLKRELLAENISMAHVMTYREEIVVYLKGLIEDGHPGELTEGHPGTTESIRDDQRKEVAGLPMTSPLTTRAPVDYVPLRLFGDPLKRSQDGTDPPHVYSGEVIDGTFEGSPASMIILHLLLTPEKGLWPQLLAAHITIWCKYVSGIGRAQIAVICPTSAKVEEAITNSYVIGDQKKSFVEGHTTSAIDGTRQAVWDISEDKDFGALGIASRLCIGLIVVYRGDSFRLSVGITTTIKTKWMLPKSGDGGKILRVEESFARPRRDIILTSENLAALVDERNKQSPLLPSARSLIESPRVAVSSLPDLAPLITRSSLSNIPPFLAPEQLLQWR